MNIHALRSPEGMRYMAFMLTFISPIEANGWSLADPTLTPPPSMRSPLNFRMYISPTWAFQSSLGYGWWESGSMASVSISRL